MIHFLPALAVAVVGLLAMMAWPCCPKCHAGRWHQRKEEPGPAEYFVCRVCRWAYHR